jgi:hypothetical protein
MTKHQAERLAKMAPDYVARRVRHTRDLWCVWCTTSDHVVEFDQKTIDAVSWTDLRRINGTSDVM